MLTWEYKIFTSHSGQFCQNLVYTWQVTLFQLFKSTFNLKETRVNHYRQDYVHFSLCNICNSVTAGKAITSWSLKRIHGIFCGVVMEPLNVIRSTSYLKWSRGSYFYIDLEHQMLRVRISGVIPLLPSVPSWHVWDFTFSNLELPPCSSSQN